MPPAYFGTILDQKLIKLVRENPLLYNPDHPMYSSSDDKELTWQKISDAMGRPTRRCKSRWLNIRDQMRRSLRLRKEHPEEKLGKKYRYELELQFLMPYFKLLKSGEDLSEYADDSILKDTTEQFDEETPISFLKYKEDADSLHLSDSYQNQEEDGFASTSKGQEFEERGTGGQELNPSDPLDLFLMTIGSTLKKFTPYYLNQAKSKIFQICQDYELQQITDKPG